MPNHMVHRIALKDIDVSDKNVRSESEADKDLQELADSIKRHGQPGAPRLAAFARRGKRMPPAALREIPLPSCQLLSVPNRSY